MEITTNAIIFLHVFYCVVGEYVAPEVKPTLQPDYNASTIQPNSTPHEQHLQSQSEIVAATIPPPSDEISRPLSSNNSVNSKSTATLVQKVISAIRSKPPLASVSEKQIFNGRLPIVIERIVQRIQNFFSVRNPPEYFENSRPPLTSDNGVIECTDNVQNDSIACNSLIISQENTATEVDCDDGPTESETIASTQPPAPGDSVNVVVTHTVVHDDTINVYSPETDATAPTHVFSNVVVILEPSADEYSPPAQPDPNRQNNKFYVYVNPTAANKKKDQQETGKLGGGDDERPQPFEPFTNATYTVVIKGDKLEEFSNNIENGDNNSLNPDLSTYFDNTTEKLGKLEAEETELTKTIVSTKSANAPGDVPNINLVLVPPEKIGEGKPSCTKDQYQSSDIEYFILKPDNGMLNKKKNATGLSQKIDAGQFSAAYLPPSSNDDSSRPTNTVNNIVSSGTNTRFPSFFNLFNRRPEEPRVRDAAIG